MNHVCKSLGDCGSYTNIAGKFTNKGAVWKSDGQRKILSGILGDLHEASGLEQPQTTDQETQTQTIDPEPENTFENTEETTQ